MAKTERSKNKRGFTLTEVMIATLIFALLSAAMLGLFIQNSRVWQMLAYQSDMRSTARNALNFMSQELRNATRTSTEIPSPNLSIPSQPNNYSVDFYLPLDQDSNGLIIDSIGNTEWDKSNKIQYQYIPGQKLLRRLEQGNQYTISNDVSAIEFQDNSIDPGLANNELRMILALTRNTAEGRTVSVQETAVIKLRNQ